MLGGGGGGLGGEFVPFLPRHSHLKLSLKVLIAAFARTRLTPGMRHNHSHHLKRLLTGASSSETPKQSYTYCSVPSKRRSFREARVSAVITRYIHIHINLHSQINILCAHLESGHELAHVFLHDFRDCVWIRRDSVDENVIVGRRRRRVLLGSETGVLRLGHC